MILNDKEIKEKINAENLVEGFINLDKQITPNGFDISVNKVFTFKTDAHLDFSNKERKLPDVEEMVFDNEWVTLPQGCYKLRSNETTNLLTNMIGIMRPRSTLLRSGCTVDTGVIDAGYKGKLEFLLIVNNQHGIRLKRNARVVQLVFIMMNNNAQKGYDGIYQGTK